MRLTVAKWLRDTSLGTKLSSFIALIVVAVVTSVAYLEVQSFEQHIEGDLMDSARLGAFALTSAALWRVCSTLHQRDESNLGLCPLFGGLPWPRA